MTSGILKRIINDKPCAFAYVNGDGISGTISFYSYKDGTVMIYEIHGLPVSKNEDEGIFGFHIHEGDTCINDTNISYEKTFGHLNPTNKQHPYHLGDLPPLFAVNGTAWAIVFIDKFKPEDIMNRTIVIHDKPDDFHTQPSGNSQTKIACGVIKKFY